MRSVVQDQNSDSGSDDEWLARQRTPWKSKKKVVVESDSEADSPLRRSVQTNIINKVIDLTISEDDGNDNDKDEVETVGDTDEEGAVTLGDTDEEGEGEGRVVVIGDESEEEEYGEYDLVKHYDESSGSLKDFIVDDSEDSEEDEEDDGHQHRYPSDEEAVISDIEEVDVEGHDYGVEAIVQGKPRHQNLVLPDLSSLNIKDSPPPNRKSKPRKPISPSLPQPNTKRDKQAWEWERARIAQEVFTDLDRRVFEGRLNDAKMEWSKRLLTTAGQAASRKVVKSDGKKVMEDKIVLSEKVLTGEDQIICTVAHEMCHLACWIISNDRKNPHGKVFKSWGRKVMRARPDIEVTTTHDYVIEYKYKWKCSGWCGQVYKRHSKSIDPKKDCCYVCKSELEPLFKTKAVTPFQLYLKENMAHAKAALPGSSHGVVMRALSHQWQSGGPEADHQSHWRAMVTAIKA